MGWEFPWYSSYGSDFNYDFHATLDDRVAPVLLHFRTQDELAEAGTPWTGGPWTEDMNGEEMPGISVFLQVDGEVFHTYSTYGRGIEAFHNGYHYLDLTALGRQEEWEEPHGRAEPLGLQVGGPAMRVPDAYDTGSESRWSGAAGSRTVTQSPPAGRAVRVSVPPCAWAMLLTIARPRPMPPWSVLIRSVPR